MTRETPTRPTHTHSGPPSASAGPEPAAQGTSGRLDEPLLTIVVTTKDRPQLVERAVRSAIRQRDASVEVIVVDDGSAVPYVPHDPAVEVVRLEKSQGVCAARNRGLGAARGAYIAFLDDDDELHESFARRGLEAVRRSTLPPPVASLGGRALADEDGVVVQRLLPPTLPRGSHWVGGDLGGRDALVHNTLVAPTDVLRRIGGFDPRFRAWVHDDLFERLLSAASLQGHDHVVYTSLLPSDARSHVSLNAPDVAATLLLLVEEHGHRMSRTTRSRHLAAASWNFLLAGSWAAAVRAAAAGLLCQPGPRTTARLVLALAGPSALRRLRSARRRWSRLVPVSTRAAT